MLVGLHDVDGLAPTVTVHLSVDAIVARLNEVHTGDTAAIHLAKIDVVRERSTSETESLYIVGSIDIFCFQSHALVVWDVN